MSGFETSGAFAISAARRVTFSSGLFPCTFASRKMRFTVARRSSPFAPSARAAFSISASTAQALCGRPSDSAFATRAQRSSRGPAAAGPGKRKERKEKATIAMKMRIGSTPVGKWVPGPILPPPQDPRNRT